MTITKFNKKRGTASSEDIKIMIDELRDYRDDDRLSKWEKAFYDNIQVSIDHERELTDHQILKLREIYEEYCV